MQHFKSSNSIIINKTNNKNYGTSGNVGDVDLGVEIEHFAKCWGEYDSNLGGTARQEVAGEGPQVAAGEEARHEVVGEGSWSSYENICFYGMCRLGRN